MSKPTIICIDDEILVLTSLRDSLTQHFGTDYAVEIVESGEEALEVISELAEENAEIPLIISDQIMPGMKGDQLLAQIHHQYPKTLKILLTGQASADDIGKALNQANLYRYIAKPWDTTTLNTIVCEGLRAYFNDKHLLESHDFLTALNQELEYQVSQRTQQLQQEIETRRQAEVQLQQRSDYIARFSDNLRQLHRLSTSHYPDFAALLQDYLATGCQLLDFTTGVVARLEADCLIVTAVHSDLSGITPGQIFPLSGSYCQSVVEQQRTITNVCLVTPPNGLQGIAFNPGFQAYLGTPIWVNDTIYGTLSFSACLPKSLESDEQDQELIELMALSIGRIVENQLAQQQLQAREVALKEAQKLAHLGNWDYDILTGKITWSEEKSRIFGRDRRHDPSTYEELLELLHPDDRDLLAGAVQRAIKQGLPYCLEYRIHHPDGQLRYLEGRGKVVRNSTGQVVRLFGTVLDITARKQAQAALEHRIHLEQLIASISSQFINLTPERVERGIETALQRLGEFAKVDRSYLFQLGEDSDRISNTHEWCAPGIDSQKANLQQLSLSQYPWFRAKLINLEVIHIISVADLPPEAAIEQALLQGQSIQSLLVVPIVSQEKLFGFIGFDSVRQTTHWAAETINSLRLVGEIFASALKQQQIEQALRQAEAKYRQIYDNASEGIYQTSPDGRYLSANRALARIYGYETAEELIASYSNIGEQLYVDPQRRQEFICLLETQEEVFQFESQVYRRDETVIWICETARLVRDTQGIPLYYEGLVSDVTMRKQAEAALEAAKLAAERSNQSKSTFIANMSHELRTPLHAIMGFAQLLSGDRNLNQGQQEQLTTIRSSSEHLLNLIDELLDFSKIEAKRVARHDSDFDLYQLLEELRQILRLKAVQKGLQLKVVYGSDLPRWVRSDRLKLRQILLNLLGNAIKFTPQGGVVLTAITFPQFPSVTGQSRLVFSVADTGIGMTAEELEQIFEPFVQADSSNFSTEGGAGLGLAISREYAQLLGGELAVTSQKNQGTVFQLSLDVLLVAAAVESQPPCSVSPVESTSLMDLGEKPLPWRQALEAAVLDLDRDRLQQLLDEMPPSQAHLQAALETCLKNFEYRRILQALSSFE